jgi:predicted nucleotidyltransferase
MTLEELRKLKPQIQSLARQYKIDPDSIRVFGSVARGDNGTKSDIDFLIKPIGECSIFDLAGFYEDLGEMLHCEVDVVSERAIFPAMREAILSNATPI